MTDKRSLLEPLSVTVIGTGDGGEPLTSGTIAKTADAEQPNLIVNVISPLTAIAIRAANFYLTALVGLVGTAAVVAPGDFGQQLAAAAGLALGPTAIAVLKDLITVFGRLEGKYPLSTGAV